MNKHIKNLILSGMLLAIGIVLPFLTGQIQQIGNMLLPMHIPVLLCGLICGWRYGGAVGLVMPLLRNLLFRMPPMPNAVSMAFELAAYGLIVGLLYGRSKWKCIFSLYRSMLIAMVSGRVVWGVVQAAILGIGETAFTFKMFMAGALFNAVPGIILQLILVPAIMIALDKAKLVPFSKKKPSQTPQS
ncbi:MAG TPA: ECF transporter S component [Ruminococcaceae bacterium]|nr:ECF transporter S component [Oscillospiraceae bacterium]